MKFKAGDKVLVNMKGMLIPSVIVSRINIPTPFYYITVGKSVILATESEMHKVIDVVGVVKPKVLLLDK